MSGESHPSNLRLFGSVRVERGDWRVDAFPTRRSAYLLARVAISTKKRVGRLELAEALWPDDFADATRVRLRQELWRLKAALGPVADMLIIDSDAVRLDPARVIVDVELFESAYRLAATTLDPEERNHAWRTVAELGESPFIVGADEDWVIVERDRLAGMRFRALVALGEDALELGDFDVALEFGMTAIESHPRREAARLLAMKAYVGMGHVVDAQSQFQAYRRLVGAEIGGRVSASIERYAATLGDQEIVPAPIAAKVGLTYGLPPASGPVVGRESEIAELTRRLDVTSGRRLVSVVGIGGIGKTTLVAEAVRRIAPEYEGRVVFVELSEIADPSVVPSAILRSLGLAQAPTGDPFAHLLRVLPGEPVLLALDNVEQFGSAIGDFVRRVLDERRQVRIVVTSRAPLHLHDEFKLSLAPLTPPTETSDRESALANPAVRLLVGRVAGDADEVDADWRSLAQIARLVEGVPLALELAASRLRTVGPRELIDDLESGKETLVSRTADLPERHRSARNAVEGTLSGLDPESQASLAKLSVFRGGWSLDAARDVCGFVDPAATMETLLDASLITSSVMGGRRRFAMLESIRTFVVHGLSPAERDQLRARHADWIARLTRPDTDFAITRGALERLSAIDLEHDNLREAMAYAIDFDRTLAFQIAANARAYWIYHTNGFEARRYLDRLFAEYSDVEPTLDILRASYAHATIYHHFVTSWEDTERTYERTLELGRRLGDRRFELPVKVFCAYLEHNRLNYAKGEAIIEELERSTDHPNYVDFEPMIYRIAAGYALFRGDVSLAFERAHAARKRFIEMDEVFYEPMLRYSLAETAIEAHDYDLAEASLDGLAQELSDRKRFVGVARVYSAGGTLQFHLGRYDAAIAWFEAAKPLWHDLGDEFQFYDLQNLIGRCELAKGRIDVANRYFREASAGWLRQDCTVACSVALVGASRTLLDSGKRSRAMRVMRVVEREFETYNARLLRLHADLYKQVKNEVSADPEYATITGGSLHDAVLLARLANESLDVPGERA